MIIFLHQSDASRDLSKAALNKISEVVEIFKEYCGFILLLICVFLQQAITGFNHGWYRWILRDHNKPCKPTLVVILKTAKGFQRKIDTKGLTSPERLEEATFHFDLRIGRKKYSKER
jgi:hypothetical protein